MSIHSIRQDWFSNIRGDVLAGLVVALALLPEALLSTPCWLWPKD